jgi:hypothetical protein
VPIRGLPEWFGRSKGDLEVFTKGQRVKYVQSFNYNTAVWYVRDAIVTACGKKQMTLVDAHTGKPMGRSFKPQAAQYGASVVLTGTMDEAKEVALQKSEEERLGNIERMDRQMAHSAGNHSYVESIAADQAKLKAAIATVVTPYEPGHEYGPKVGEPVEQHVPRTKGKTFIARYNGVVVGERTSHRPYTHAVICEKAGKIVVGGFSASEANASRLNVYGGRTLAIVAVEVK